MKLLYLLFYFLNLVVIEYVKKLVECILKSGKVFFINFGMEVIEMILKLIDKYRFIVNEECDGVVVLKDSFYGRMLGVLYFMR